MSSRDSRVRALIDLARRMPTGESARRDAVSFANFEARLERRRSGRARFWSRPRVQWAGCALVALTAGTICWALLPDRQPPALRYVLEPLASVAGEAAPGVAAQRLQFSDGSRVTLEPSAEAKVVELGSNGAHVVLARGQAEVAIARRKNAAWLLQAGPYKVRVTGTAFRLIWSADREQIEVDMRHGSVVVTGPMAGSGVALHAGQRLLGLPRERRLVVEDWPRASAAPSAVSAPLQPAAVESPAGAGREGARPAFGVRGWAKQVARGEFAAVLGEARAAGLGRVLAAAPAADLAALADAARYARQNALGRKALLALRERFPHAAEARDSAFLLGRLSGGENALAWYDRYLGEQPVGSYASQALGRSMMLRYERGERALAASLASSYLLRFPGGPYAESARKLSAPVRGDHTAP
jgi:hypothetical protein